MKSLLSLSAFTMMSLSAMSAPIVSDVTVRQLWSERKVVITYTLSGEDAIVTAVRCVSSPEFTAPPNRD